MSDLSPFTGDDGSLEVYQDQYRFFGIYTGKVTDNKDPENRYRVRVQIWSLQEDTETGWARVACFMAGAEIGGQWLPEVDDEVIVAFIQGDWARPIVLGSLYHGVNKCLQDFDHAKDDINEKLPNNDQGGKNDFRIIRSRGEHHLAFGDRDGEGFISLRTKAKAELILDDKDGSEKVGLYDKNRDQWLEIDVKEKKITLQTDQKDILIKAKETLTMECKDLVIKADKTIKVESGTTSEWKAGSELKWESGSTSDFEAGGTMTLKAPKIDLNP
jgi:uncharacterized protein involved in type VI secretion and phage assembly